jgi:DNA-binding YbaB/EbfC family protein
MVSDVPDMNEILRQAMAMQEQLLAAQQEASERLVVGSAGGGLVRVTLTGSGEPTGVHIASEAIDPDDPEILEDLVLAALRDALHALRELQASAVGGLDLAALGFGDLGLGGMPGGGDAPPELERPDGGE